MDLKKQVAELTELVAEENNPQKFLELLTQLNEILDRLNSEESRNSASSGESES